MHRFEALLERAHIDLADLHPAVEVNGLLVYFGTFPNGYGRLFLHPDIPLDDDPRFIALIAHELSHVLLSVFTDHPSSVVPLLLDPTQRALYNYYEAEADQLAAHLLVPPPFRSAYPSSRYPTPESLAEALGVPVAVVLCALATQDYDPVPIRDYLAAVTGQVYFVPGELALAA